MIAYVIIAGVAVAMHPSSNVVEIIQAGLLWPLPVFEFVWDHMASFYGRMFD